MSRVKSGTIVIDGKREDLYICTSNVVCSMCTEECEGHKQQRQKAYDYKVL